VRHFLFGFGLFLMAPPAFSVQGVPERCETSAASFVERRHQDDYDREGFQGFNCQVSANGSAIVCKVAASKGNGAALDLFDVVMNLACSYALRIELVGEE
jgi:hypothetical protein